MEHHFSTTYPLPAVGNCSNSQDVLNKQTHEYSRRFVATHHSKLINFRKKELPFLVRLRTSEISTYARMHTQTINRRPYQHSVWAG